MATSIPFFMPMDGLYDAGAGKRRSGDAMDGLYAVGAGKRRSGDAMDGLYAAGTGIPNALATLAGQA